VAAIPELAQAALGDDDSSVRCAAARALAVLDVPESVPHLMKAFESEKDFHVRLGHAYLFSNMRCDGVNAALLKLLEDPDPMYRIAAAHGLGWRHARDCSGELIRALRGDVDADVRADAAVALGLARASEASADLIEALNSDESDWVRASAAYALGDLRSREAFPHLVRALRTSKDVDVRMNAAVALGFLFGRQVHVYEEMLRDFQRRPPEAPTG
jgi:HEAT repeat protein